MLKNGMEVQCCSGCTAGGKEGVKACKWHRQCIGSRIVAVLDR